MTDEKHKLLCEMIEYARSNNIFLYLEIRDYALQNRPDWVEILKDKKVRSFLISYTSSLRRVKKIKKNCFSEYCENYIKEMS